MLNYKVHADKSSMFNTPPVFSVYVSMLNMRWLKKMGGISSIEDLEQLKTLEPNGVDQAISGKAIYEGKIDLKRVFKCLQSE